MSRAPDHATEDDPRLLRMARDYLAELEAGRLPDRTAYLVRYPELAPELGECLDGVEIAHAAGQALGAPPAPPPEPAPQALGDFRIVREIGRGGMGVVYEAVQLSLGRRVALKVLPFAAGLDAKQLQRFKTESHAAAQLHHTNIVPVHAVGCERGVHFYAMQLIDGRPLDCVIRELRDGEAAPGAASAPTLDLADGPTAAPISVPNASRAGRGREFYASAARLIAQAADALEYAHDAGVVHRDIKPANLLLDAKGTLWVTDFGLAQISANTGVTQTGDVFGTLRYMSPEQASGRRVLVDHRTDVYSLGATLYELLALEPLFAGKDRRELLRQVLHDEPRPPRKVDRGIPHELETVVLKALAKSPGDRYGSAGELAGDLRRFLDGRPILARRPSAAERARKWLRRHPPVVAAAVAVLLVTVVVLAASTALIAREQGRTRAALDREAAGAAVIAREQQRTQEALERERERAEEAEARFRLAKRTADELIRMAQEELIDQPHLQGLRKRLLETALIYYQELIELRRGDAEARAELAATRDDVKQVIDDLAVIQGAGDYALLGEGDVLDDLKADAGLRRKLAEFRKHQSERRDEVFRKFRHVTEEERQQRFAEAARADEAELVTILTAGQIIRLHQIGWQRQGLRAFGDLETAARLGLSPEQRERIRALEADQYIGRHDGSRGFPKGSPSREDADRRFRAAVAKAVAELKQDQLAKWKDMTGDEFRGSLVPRPFGLFAFGDSKNGFGFGGSFGRGPGERGPGGPGGFGSRGQGGPPKRDD
jgi:serine/threonine protein kinase